MRSRVKTTGWALLVGTLLALHSEPGSLASALRPYQRRWRWPDRSTEYDPAPPRLEGVTITTDPVVAVATIFYNRFEVERSMQ